MCRQMDRQTDRQMYIWTDRCIYDQTDVYMDRQMDRQMYMWIDRRTDMYNGQTDRQRVVGE